MISLHNGSKSSDQNPIDDSDYLTQDFYKYLNALKEDALKKTKTGLTPKDYDQYSKLLTCYSAAQAAIKQLTS
jgi:hypothetical protein